MPLPLHQSDAINSVASVLYDFLPGSGDRSWTGHTTFATVAQTSGVADFWPGGSKQKALVRLLTRTLEDRPGHFEKLIVTIVREGLTYRAKNPVTKSEILALNELIEKLGFKFPDLWEPRFLDSLAAKVAPAPETAPVRPPANLAETRRKLEQLRLQFYSLASQADRNAAGTAFQRLFGDLLELFGLNPKPAYRVIGEEIDGHFVLDHETYLVETKWESGPLSEGPLLVFRGKVEGKSNISRGVFVAVNGYTDVCLTAIRAGKQPNFFLLEGESQGVKFCTLQSPSTPPATPSDPPGNHRPTGCPMGSHCQLTNPPPLSREQRHIQRFRNRIRLVIEYRTSTGFDFRNLRTGQDDSVSRYPLAKILLR